ncbi:MAG: hypothetical protein H7Z19_21895 [Chitinophagaceae bacterium]|nr:hypothetical protein [Rubrivivax sp.]
MSIPSLTPLVKTAFGRGAAMLALALLAQAGHAQQQATFALQSSTVLNAAVFRFSGQLPLDGYTGPQTGLASSAMLETNGGVRALLNANGSAQVQVRYDPIALTPGPGNGVLASFSGAGSDLSIALPAGTTGTPLSFAKPASTPGFFGLVNNGNLTQDVALFTPGSTDAVLWGLAPGSFSNTGLTLANTPGLVSKVDLLADPQFVATYNGAVPLPALSSLTVTLQHGTSVQLNDPSFQLVDLTGTALGSLAPPATIPFDLFGRGSALLPFDGTLQLSLSPTDFASDGDFALAQAWVQSSGLQSQALLRQVAVWEVSPVPEAEVWLLMLLGLAAIARRRELLKHRSATVFLLGASLGLANSVANAQLVQYQISGSVPAPNSLSAQIADFQTTGGMVSFSAVLTFDTQAPPVIESDTPLGQEYRYPVALQSVAFQFGGYSFQNQRSLLVGQSPPYPDETITRVINATSFLQDRVDVIGTDLSLYPGFPAGPLFNAYAIPANVVLNGVPYTSMNLRMSSLGLSLIGSSNMLPSAAIPTAPTWATGALLRTLQFDFDVTFSGPSGTLLSGDLNFTDVDFGLVAAPVPEPAAWSLWLVVLLLNPLRRRLFPALARAGFGS